MRRIRYNIFPGRKSYLASGSYGPDARLDGEAAEKALGLSLPESYREFLRTFGAGSYGSFSVFGIPDPELALARVPNAVWYTLQERKSGLPAPLVVVSTDFDGVLCCLDTAAAAGGEAPMVVWQEGKVEPLDLNFSQYFRDGIEEEGEEKD